MRTIHLSFLGVIHKIFQLELLAIPKHDLLCKAKLAGKNVRKSYIRMRPAAIALNYSVKDIRNDVHQIMSGSMTGDHNRPCYQDVKLSPSARISDCMSHGSRTVMSIHSSSVVALQLYLHDKFCKRIPQHLIVCIFHVKNCKSECSSFSTL